MERQRRRVDYIVAERFADVAEYAARSNTVGATVHVAADEQTYYRLVRRRVGSEVEVHARWDDIVIVRAGRGGMEVGDSVSGARRVSGGEWRGGTLGARRMFPLKPGDVLRVPAAVPHAFVADSALPLELLIIKVRRPGLPLR